MRRIGKGRSSKQKWAGWLLAVGGLTSIFAVAGVSQGGVLITAPIIKASQGLCSFNSVISQIDCAIGTLKSGEHATIEVAVTALQDGLIINTAQVSGDEPDPKPGNNTAVEHTRVDPVADVAVTKSDAPDPVTVGQPLTYTMVVVNKGPSTATGVVLTDFLPPHVTAGYATSSKGLCTTSASTVTCYLGALPSGSGATITVTVTPTKSGVVVNKAVVKGSEFDPHQGNNIATTQTTVKDAPKQPSADLSVTKTDNPDPAKVGDQIVYTITVANNGPDDATGVHVVDTLDAKDP